VISTVAAWYAAVLATVVAIWNGYGWWHDRRLRMSTGLNSETRGMEWGGAYRVMQMFDANFRNDSPFEVQLKEAGYFGRTSAGELVTWRLKGQELPMTVKPRHFFSWSLPYAELADFGLDLQKGVQAWGSLATGEVTYSGVIYPVRAGQLAMPSPTPRARPPDDPARRPPPAPSPLPWRRWGSRAR
jgi:hypothetical protein